MKLGNKIRLMLLAGVMMLAGAGVLWTQRAMACDCQNHKAVGDDCTSTQIVQCGMDETKDDTTKTDLPATVTNIIKGVLYVVGIIAVVMVIIGGVQYATSAGDQNAVTKAKNTILYGIIGLVIAILAYAIVSFVVGRLG